MRFGALSAVALLSLSVACGGGDDKKNGKKLCDAGASVNCEDVPPGDVGGRTFVAGLATATCASDGQSWNVTSCTEIGGAAWAFCDDGLVCQSALECVGFDHLVARCLKDCSGGGSCDGSTKCIQDYCLPIVSTGNECFINDGNDTAGSCATAGDVCEPTAYYGEDTTYSSCTRPCDSEKVGTSDGCNAGETCIASKYYLEIQPAGAPDCTMTGPNPCDAANGYRCHELRSGLKCAREPGNCIGSVYPMYATMNDLGVLDSEIQSGNFDHACALPPQERSDNTDYGGEIYFNNTACGVRGATGLPADVLCLRYGVDFGICVGFCELDSGDELDCGAGYHCDAPPQNQAAFFTYEKDGSTDKTCTGTTDTSCGAGFTCFQPPLDDGFYCVKPMQLCLPN